MRVFNLFDDATLAPDEQEPDGYRAPFARVGRELGAERLAASVVLLHQGQAVCPYHYEHGEEEWLVVLSGTPTVRTPRGEEVLEAGDVMAFPRGPSGAHKIANTAAEPARVLIVAEHTAIAATTYEDSDKIGVIGSDGFLLFQRADAVDYWHGE